MGRENYFIFEGVPTGASHQCTYEQHGLDLVARWKKKKRGYEIHRGACGGYIGRYRERWIKEMGEGDIIISLHRNMKFQE